MSLRTTEEAEPQPPQPQLAPPRPLVASTGCGMSMAMGAVIPCGVVISHGDYTLGNTYIITSRGLSSLNRSGQLVSRATSAPAKVYDVQRAVKAIGNYGNVYGYGVSEQYKPFVAEACLDGMGAIDYSSKMTGGRLGEAYAAVHRQCRASYGSDYTMVAFRK